MWWIGIIVASAVFFSLGFLVGTLYDNWLERNEGDYADED